MFTRILFVCHKVFYHQINAWIVHGQLVDICQEFFIHKLEHNKGKGPTPVDATKEDKSELNKTNVSGVTNKEGVIDLSRMFVKMIGKLFTKKEDILETNKINVGIKEFTGGDKIEDRKLFCAYEEMKK